MIPPDVWPYTGGISKQTYVYFSFLSSVVDVQDPLKLTLIMVKRRTSCVLTLSGGVGLGAMYMACLNVFCRLHINGGVFSCTVLLMASHRTGARLLL